jgi:hypothetical protein
MSTVSDHDDRSGLWGQWRGHYASLLITLLLVLAVFPFVGDAAWMRWVLLAALFVMMTAALIACGVRRRVFFVLALVGFASIAMSSWTHATGDSAGRVGGHGLRFVFFLIVTLVVFSDVLGSKRVTMNTVFGACCVYLLMGLGWASVYSTMEAVQPGSFAIETWPPEPVAAVYDSIDSQLAYFSLITLTTIGYGDIIPVSPQARTLAALEGLIGQLFLAIIIARLVALEISARLWPRS